MNVDNTEEFRCISFCTGYAGIELGLREVIPNLRTVAYVEVEAFACANLVAKIEENKLDAAPIWTNLKTFNGEPFRDRVHLITGGYPCQPFSHAGQRKGADDPRHLWPYILEHIRTIRPVWCFFENVSGHLSLGFDEVFKSLRDLGYKVEAGLFTAAEVGTPHKRERLFILGYSEECCGRGVNGYNNRPPKQNGNRDEQFKCRGGDKPISQTSKGTLANSDHWQSRPAVVAESAKTEQPKSGDDSGERRELADSKNQRFGRSKPKQSGWQCNGICTASGSSVARWPARPGQPQYVWEEPRTVKSGVGRTVDRFASRVDELRLLGNGVVPQTAEKAFRTLMELF